MLKFGSIKKVAEQVSNINSIPSVEPNSRIQLTILNNISDIQQLRRQYPRVHLVTLAETRHLYDQARRHLLQFNITREETLLEQLLHGGQLEVVVLFDEELIVVRLLARIQF